MTYKLLRPEFTKQLAERLLQGESINLTAPHGFGRRRTLQDLKTLLPASMGVLQADMKDCANDYAATLTGLYEQAGLSGKEDACFKSLITMLAEKAHPSLLVLHNFDLLRCQPHDPRYDQALLPYLAGFRQYPKLSLLTVCEMAYADWPLPCSTLTIPPLHPGDSAS